MKMGGSLHMLGKFYIYIYIFIIYIYSLYIYIHYIYKNVFWKHPKAPGSIKVVCQTHCGAAEQFLAEVLNEHAQQGFSKGFPQG